MFRSSSILLSKSLVIHTPFPRPTPWTPHVSSACAGFLHGAVANDAIDKLPYTCVRELCTEADFKAFVDIVFDVCNKVRLCLHSVPKAV